MHFGHLWLFKQTYTCNVNRFPLSEYFSSFFVFVLLLSLHFYLIFCLFHSFLFDVVSIFALCLCNFHLLSLSSCLASISSSFLSPVFVSVIFNLILSVFVIFVFDLNYQSSLIVFKKVHLKAHRSVCACTLFKFSGKFELFFPEEQQLPFKQNYLLLIPLLWSYLLSLAFLQWTAETLGGCMSQSLNEEQHVIQKKKRNQVTVGPDQKQ